MKEAEEMMKAVVQLMDAVRVIVLTPHIREYLLREDPKALEQLQTAIREGGVLGRRFLDSR